MKIKTIFYRVFFYSVGMLILALGVTLNTKTGLGVSAIVSIPYCIANFWNMNFGNVTFLTYVIFVLIQIIIKKKNTRLLDIMQIAVSLVFTRFLNLFGDTLDIHFENVVINFVLLLIAIILTGVGVAMSVNARLIANPADGIVQTIADTTKLDMGLVKNILDLICILTSVIISLIFKGRLIGIGIGTILVALGVGRVIWLYNNLFKKKIELISGIE